MTGRGDWWFDPESKIYISAKDFTLKEAEEILEQILKAWSTNLASHKQGNLLVKAGEESFYVVISAKAGVELPFGYGGCKIRTSNRSEFTHFQMI